MRTRADKLVFVAAGPAGKGSARAGAVIAIVVIVPGVPYGRCGDDPNRRPAALGR